MDLRLHKAISRRISIIEICQPPPSLPDCYYHRRHIEAWSSDSPFRKITRKFPCLGTPPPDICSYIVTMFVVASKLTLTCQFCYGGRMMSVRRMPAHHTTTLKSSTLITPYKREKG